MTTTAQMTPAEARVAQPVLTNVARGFKNQRHAWPFLFPVVGVAQRGGKVVEFNAEDFAEVESVRAPGANRARVNLGYGSQSYALTEHSLDGQVTKEEIEDANVVPIDTAANAVAKTMGIVYQAIEIEAAELALKSANYPATNRKTLADKAQWSHDESTPAKEVEAAKEAIATGIGRDPNVLVLGDAVWRALLNNEDVIDRIKHTEGLKETSAPLVNAGKLAQYFGVDMVVRAGARKGKKGAFKSIWGKHAVLAYSEVSSLASMGSPSFGYCYRLNNYPVARPGRWDGDCDSWLYAVTTYDTPVIAGKEAGFLFSDVVA